MRRLSLALNFRRFLLRLGHRHREALARLRAGRVDSTTGFHSLSEVDSIGSGDERQSCRILSH